MAEAEHADGTAWMITDPPAGRSLADILRTDGRIDLASACTIGVAVLSALAAAHAEGIVHGDVTPSNIMVADDGQVRLIGFGAGHRMDDARAGVAGMPVSSVPYLAPERSDGVTTPACDLFALGVTLYQALEGGQSPFQRDSVESTIEAVRTFAPPAPANAGDLAPLLWLLLAKDHTTRITAAAALANLQPPPPRAVEPRASRAPQRSRTEVIWKFVVPSVLLAALVVMSELPVAAFTVTYPGGFPSQRALSMRDMLGPFSRYSGTQYSPLISLWIVLSGAAATVAGVVLRGPDVSRPDWLLGYLGAPVAIAGLAYEMHYLGHGLNSPVLDALGYDPDAGAQASKGYLGAPIAILGFARLIWHFGAGVHSPMLFTVHYSDKWGEETSSLAPAAWLFYTILVALFVLYASRDKVVSRRAGVRSPLPPPAYTPAPPR